MTTYRAFRIHQDKQGHRAGIEDLPKPEPAEGEVLIQISHSGVNYKDSLAGTGRGKILRTFPLTGGADGQGWWRRRDTPLPGGGAVVFTGWGLTFDHDGGFAQYLCCPGDWLVPIPAGLDPRTAMIHGTAGFTAAIAAHRMLVNGQRPELGPILVTGATGGVGSIAVAIFARLGYEVVAVSGKPDLEPWLRALGASRVIGRDGLAEAKRPLERAQWGGAVDNVGGGASSRRSPVPSFQTATSRVSASRAGQSCTRRSCPSSCAVSACSAVIRWTCPRPCTGSSGGTSPRTGRLRIWSPSRPEPWRLDGLPEVFERMMDGRTHGRILVEP